MEKERLSRRDFLKVAGTAAFSMVLPSAKEVETREPLTDLPKFITQDTPVYIETLTRGGSLIDSTLPGNSYYYPEWVHFNGLPLDILTPIRPERGYEVPGALGPVAWVADVPHATGIYPPLMHVVVGFSQDESRMEIMNGSLRRKNEDIVATYAFSDRSRIYPSKIYNILTALTCISEWQQENGPLTPGSVYSYLDMSGVIHRNAERFLIGGYVDAGGVCASVTTMSKCVFLASAMGLTEEVARVTHSPNLQYGENPLDRAITRANSDATVEWYPLHSDYRFRVLPGSPPLYFSFSADLVLNEEPVNPASPARHRSWPSDARLTFTISLRKTLPDYAKERESLNLLRNQYAEFHNFDDGFLGGRTPDGVIVRP
ncbi:MAG TPA: hypothetical protein VJ481_00735 [Patescibacteria group bacterium]|uniref:Uncharacterized protein n=1 Tax=Candidatus Woesebacteria bacterium RBG_13_46_13 TaxID=1802479 RepID=A0A1F7X5H0_9BACT|nr:MAG: hypothetical protein A2Y68_02810 [Candidatus Woesebacteria bacterium RBG_13_46_13]HJX59070.1 hypothetical protein [Patescibacteria group bacterium]